MTQYSELEYLVLKYYGRILVLAVLALNFSTGTFRYDIKVR
jgi:hypothetical protein